MEHATSETDSSADPDHVAAKVVRVDPAHPIKSSSSQSRAAYAFNAAKSKQSEHKPVTAPASNVMDPAVAANSASAISSSFGPIRERQPTSGTSAPPSARAPSTRGQSLFARQFDAQKNKMASQPVSQATGFPLPTLKTTPEASRPFSFAPSKTPVDKLPFGESEADRSGIHRENLERITKMSQEEITQAQLEISQFISPANLAALKRKTQASAVVSSAPSATTRQPAQQEQNQNFDKIPFKVDPDWVHMDVVEKDKLAWIGDLPPVTSGASTTASTQSFKRFQVRFDLEGNPVPHGKDVPTYLGLHHHPDQENAAGYSLPELCEWIRSSFEPQRILTLQVLRKILRRAWAGGYDSMAHAEEDFGSEDPNDCILACLFGLGLPLFLRLALDDTIIAVVSEALLAFHALLFREYDHNYLGHTQSTNPPIVVAFNTVPPTSSRAETDEDQASSSEQRDVLASQKDLIKALIDMQLLNRLRYLLETYHTFIELEAWLDIVTTIAGHSLTSATAVVKCPRLMYVIVAQFLTKPDTPHQLRAKGLLLLRTLCERGRNLAMEILSSELMSSVMEYMTPEYLTSFPDETQLPLKTQTEALRLWASALRYGLHADLFVISYTSIVNQLKSFASIDFSSCNLPKIISMNAMLRVVHAVVVCASSPAASLHSVHWSNVEHLRPIIMESVRQWVCSSSQLATQPEHCERLALIASGFYLLAAFVGQEYNLPSFDTVAALATIEEIATVIVTPWLASSTLTECLHTMSTRGPSVSAPELRFTAHPSPLQGSGDNTTLASTRRAAIAVVDGFVTLLSAITRVHKGMSRSLQTLLLHPALTGYLNGYPAHHTSPRGRSDMIIYRNLPETIFLHRLLQATSFLDSSLLATSAWTDIGLLLISQVPRGYECIVDDVMKLIVCRDADQSVVTSGFLRTLACGALEAKAILVSLARLNHHLTDITSLCLPDRADSESLYEDPDT